MPKRERGEKIRDTDIGREYACVCVRERRERKLKYGGISSLCSLYEIKVMDTIILNLLRNLCNFLISKSLGNNICYQNFSMSSILRSTG